MVLRTHCLILVAWLLTNLESAAQQSYNVSKILYTRENGLPTNDVFCGAQDQQGFLWFATRDNLYRFNGNGFEYIASVKDRLGGWEIEKIVSSGEESIIITCVNPTFFNSRRKYLVINCVTYEVETIGEHFKNVPFTDTAIIAIYKTPGGKLGFFTEKPANVWHYSQETGFVVQANYSRGLKKWVSPNYAVANIFEKPQFLCLSYRYFKTILISKDSVFSLPTRLYSLLKPEDDGVGVYRYDTLTGRISGSYKMTSGGKLFSERFFEDTWLKYRENALKNIIACDNTDACILQYDNGFSFLRDVKYGGINLFEHLDYGSFLPVIKSYFVDKSGTYWICTSKGIIKLKVSLNRFTLHFNQSPGFKAVEHSSRGIYADSGLFCVNLYSETIIRKGKDTIRLNKGSNYSLLYADTGIWIGAFNLRFYDFRKKSYRMLAVSAHNEIWSILPLGDNRLLLGCTSGIGIYDIARDTIFKEVKSNPYSKPVFVYKFCRVARNKIWAVADNGIYEITNDGFMTGYYGAEAKEESRRLPFRSIHDIYPDQDGITWVGTNGKGLCRWDRKRNSFDFFDITRDFPSNVVYCIQHDGFGNLWLSTDYGLVKFNKKTGFVNSYLVKDGISENEFNRTSQFKDTKGTIYFGGINGVTSFKPADFANDTCKVRHPFYVTVGSLHSKESKEPENVTAKIVYGRKLTIKPEHNLFSLSFALLDFEEGAHQYAYRLEGVDQQWNYINENTLRFSNLPYGTYRLVIKAKTIHGYWNLQQIAITLNVIPPFYKTWWFIVLVFTGALAVSGLFIFFRLQQKVKYLQDLSNLRVRLASDLHDEVGGLLNKTAMQAEMARNIAGDDTRKLMDKIAANCRDAMSSMRDIMWNLDSRNDKTENLFDRISEYSMKMLGDHFEYSVSFLGDKSISIHPEMRQAIYLVCKEAINNIVKHASGGKVKVMLEVQKKALKLSVHSDRVFVKKEIVTGQGLKNMKMRVEKYGGTFLFNTDNGVTVSAEIPLQEGPRLYGA